jgi:hypothetical protein
MQNSLTPEQRLDILRASDQLRKWQSLDDERVCVVCEKIFSGRQIDIRRDQRGRFLLACPTPGCPAYVAHWFYVVGKPSPAAHRINRQHQLRPRAA